ncbi:MAG: SatD family protein [Candidatus Symbiothrix sp.]|nr:SatD family protein [Candidatus Symbiothrix sp.]
MNKATISADIVSSTSLNVKQRLGLEKSLNQLLDELRLTFGPEVFFGRLIKGDYIECVLEKPELALRVALLIKSYVKALDIKENKKKGQDLKDFKEYGIRVAIGVGELSIWNKQKGIIDGEAIYLSGRAINEIATTKNTLVFRSTKDDWNEVFTPVMNFLDVLFSKYKRAQSEVIFYKLLYKSEKEITEILKKGQSTINQHSTSTGWYAIKSAVDYFEKTIN